MSRAYMLTYINQLFRTSETVKKHTEKTNVTFLSTKMSKPSPKVPRYEIYTQTPEKTPKTDPGGWGVLGVLNELNGQHSCCDTFLHIANAAKRLTIPNLPSPAGDRFQNNASREVERKSWQKRVINMIISHNITFASDIIHKHRDRTALGKKT